MTWPFANPLRVRFAMGWLPIICVALLAGCGSKITEANYYKAARGMTELELEQLLGPAHEVSAGETTTQGAPATLKVWRNGRLEIRVLIQDGVVVERTGTGLTSDPETRPASSQRASAVLPFQSSVRNGTAGSPAPL